jgi:hypothetical protein
MRADIRAKRFVASLMENFLFTHHRFPPDGDVLAGSPAKIRRLIFFLFLFLFTDISNAFRCRTSSAPFYKLQAGAKPTELLFFSQ